MHSKLLRITADDTSSGWRDWAAAKAHKSLKRGLLARFAPSKNQIKAAGTALADTAIDVIGLFRKRGSDQIISVPISQTKDMIDTDGEALAIDTVYATHPLLKNVTVKAEALHSYVIKEQRAQIIRYFRSAVALKSLTVEIISQNSGKVYAGGGWKAVSAGAGKKFAI